MEHRILDSRRWSEKPYKRPGRHKLAREAPDPKGRKHARLTGWRAHRVRALMGELAYQLSVPLSATDIWRELKIACAIRQLGPPLIGERRDATWIAQFEEDKKAITKKYKCAPRGPNKFHRLLNAEREAGAATLEEIEVGAFLALRAHDHPFWEVFSIQPSNYHDYWRLGNRSLHTINRIRGCYPLSHSPDEQLQPSKWLLDEFVEYDTLDHLRIYLLIFGAAHEAGWPDLYDLCFKRMLQIVCRIACLTPFTTFGEEFAMDVLSAPFGTGRPEPPGWRNTVTTRVNEYRQLINLAMETDIIPRTATYALGQREKQISLLRYSDSVGFQEAQSALTNYRVTKLPTERCKALIAAVNKTVQFDVF